MGRGLRPCGRWCRRRRGGCDHLGVPLAGLLEQTGFNYALAESASTLGTATRSAPDRTEWAEQRCSVPSLGSAAGGSGPAPAGWSLVAGIVDQLWPNGHQDRLRAAASAWSGFARDVRQAADEVTRAHPSIAAQDAPETPDALAACRSLATQLDELADVVDSVGAACAAYAEHLDAAHAEVLDELESLLEWTAGIEATGALLSVVSFGASEAAAQVAEGARIAAAAARIASVLSRLGDLARLAAESVANLASRAAVIADAARPLLTARIVVAYADAVQPTRLAATAAARTAEERLAMDSAFATSAAGRKAIEYATSAGKLTHVFAERHKLDPLVEAFGSRESVIKGLLERISDLVPEDGFFAVQIRVNGRTVIVRGTVIDGVIRVGTAFTP